MVACAQQPGTNATPGNLLETRYIGYPCHIYEFKFCVSKQLRVDLGNIGYTSVM